MQAPMISSPLKQTSEVDWVAPLKAYIRNTYGDDPERYSEECNTLNRLRQDMRGAGKDTAAGRDLLYRYYGQLELLDLRFPVDEAHIKILFTWFDAFTHKPTSQHSLAFEKASIIFNISATLSCYAAVQNRSEDIGLKTAYHSFQASAGMFTYINENFLHAPSTDLNHQTVRTLINLMLAQAQEVFLEKQVADGKKAGLLAKLAAQASYLYSQSMEGLQQNVNDAVFENVWMQLASVKLSHLGAIAQYHQALVDSESGQHGTAIARLQAAETLAKESNRAAKRIPDSHPANSNIGSDAGSSLVEITKKNMTSVQEKLVELNKDNDFIYHSPVPSEASLSAVAKLAAAKAISVSELYQGQDVHRIIGPDIFQKIVPMSVTESASLYDEEKAKLVRAEAERVETADGEMAASLDYLKLPGSLNILKGSTDQELAVDNEFREWCEALAGHEPFNQSFDELASDKARILSLLDTCSKNLDMEESVCEKMRSKYGGDWTQQPSSRLTATLRSDIKSYRAAVNEASTSDSQLRATLKQHEGDFDEMRSAAESGEVDVLYQKAMIKAGSARGKDKGSPSSPMPEINLLDEDFEDGSSSVAEQISKVEELMRKLNLVKRERSQTLKDLKEKIHNDDISQVLILNKRAITTQDHQLFKTELEKFKPLQTRIMQANHKQSSLMKELTRTYGDLLQDKRVRSEQTKYESFSRQRNAVLSKYMKAFRGFSDLSAGLERARVFYSEMKGTVESLSQNVDSFLSNRKAEGGELLSQIERGKASGAGASADREQERLKELMARMNVDSSKSPLQEGHHRPPPLQNIPSYQQPYNPVASPPSSASFMRPSHMQSPANGGPYGQRGYGYDPTGFGPVSPPPGQQQPLASPSRYPTGPTSPPAGYVPPPPPPRPVGSAPGAPPQRSSSQQQPANANANDPWAGLSGWR